jgi:hypothetical protein
MPITVRELRRKWKPHKARLSALHAQHPTPVRFHRACSWLQRVEKLAEENDRDFALVGQWTALNARYGQWDERVQEPLPDGASLRSFIDKLIKIDTEGKLGLCGPPRGINPVTCRPFYFSNLDGSAK